MADKKSAGQEAEDAAARYLAARGLRIVTRNFHCRGGEIDIIGWDDSTLAFVEVRYRGHGSFETATESVTLRKQQRIIKAAQFYLHRHNAWQVNARFDVIAMAPGHWRRYRAQWIKNAFDASP